MANPYDNVFFAPPEPTPELPGSSIGSQHLTVNQEVPGSSPGRGATEPEPAPEYKYPAWALAIQKANCLVGVMREYSPRACHDVLTEPFDKQDLAGFRDALDAIKPVAMAVVCMAEALPYLEQDNPVMVMDIRSFLVPGGLEDYEARQKFLEKATVAWTARRQQLGPFWREMLEDEGLA